MRIRTHSLRQTKKFAGFLAREILNGKRLKIKSSLVLALSGDLGSGKTSFAQGFVRALGVRGKVTSPTFILMQRFSIPRSLHRTSNFRQIHHLDCYRLENPREIPSLGVKELLKDPQNIFLIEWAEKIKSVLPKNTIWITFAHGGKPNERIISVNQSRYQR